MPCCSWRVKPFGFAFAFALFALTLLHANVTAAQADQQKIKINESGFNSSKVCGKCHSQIYEKWKESMHARATADPIFRASYLEAHYKSAGAAEKLCMRCHAPTTRFTHEYDLNAELTSEGVTCDFCHSVMSVNLDDAEYPFDVDLGLVKHGPNRKGDVKVHDVAYSKLHSEARFCASCHEYNPNGVPVMSTYSEWKKSPYAEEGKPCQYCHMPEITGEISNNVVSERGPKIFSHDLAGGHSVIQLKKALALKITRINRGKGRLTVDVSVTNIGSGHRVPTGIPSRKLMLYCEVRTPGGGVYKDKIVYEKAIFDEDGHELTSDADIMLGHGRSVAKDNRIFPKETRREKFTFYVPESKQALVTVWVDYLYNPVIVQETEMRIEMNRDEAVAAPVTGR